MPRAWRPRLRPAWRLALGAWRIATVEAPAALSFLLSFSRAPEQVVAAWPAGPPVVGGEVALFVHYDAVGAVADRVLDTLDRLREAGLSVLFVSNAGALRDEAMAALRARCAGVLVRRNLGYDFGAMREGLRFWREALAGVRLLVLLNDSVLGPFAPLRPVLDRLDFARADVWGLVGSEQRAPHVQSWFLAVGRRALDDAAWARFWAGVRPVRSKAWVVGRSEVGFSRAMRRAGLRVAAAWGYRELLALALADAPEDASEAERRQRARVRAVLAWGGALNPTADLWRQVLHAGCPFVKRELVERNPAGVLDAAEWREAMGARSGVDEHAG